MTSFVRRTLVVGDVHGQINKLNSLLAKFNPSKDLGDKVVFVGDFVDKAPPEDCAAVVKRVRALAEDVEVIVVEGNHEETHRRFRKRLKEDTTLALSMKGHEEMLAFTDLLDEDDKAFMETFVPFQHIPEFGVLVVHGGIPGNMTEFPETVGEVLALSKTKQKSFLKIMRTRFVDAETGKFLHLGAQTEEDPFWAEVYDGRFGHVLFGHEAFDTVKCFPHATGLDTGAFKGGPLTGVVLTMEASPTYITGD